MLKPLSKNTLEKRYAELGLDENQLNLLNTYFKAFANLYGTLLLNDAWNIFRGYEGIGEIHKKDLLNFASVAQRDDLPYYIIEINEIFSEEKPSPERRLIVNRELVLRGYGKFIKIYHLENNLSDTSIYIPDRETMLSFAQDPFYETKQGKAFADFIGKLKSTGEGNDFGGRYEIKDLDGNSVKGKCMKDFISYSPDDEFTLEYYKKPGDKEYYLKQFTRTSCERILDYVKERILIGEYFKDESPLVRVMNFMINNFGAELSDRQMKKFIELYQELNNNSNMWCLHGWKPVELSRQQGMPETIELGPNIKKMIKNGEYNLEEIKEYCNKLGIKITISGEEGYIN